MDSEYNWTLRTEHVAWNETSIFIKTAREPSSAAERETAREPSSVAESAAERGAERDRACVRDHASKVK